MFPELRAFEADEAFLRAIGRSGGLCDCGDDVDTPESLSESAAGRPIFGQFVAQDITADRSALQSHVDPRRLRNARAPQLNLECLYGDGPVGHPFLYQRDDPAKLSLGPSGSDVPRNAEGIAIVDDARRRGVPEPGVFESAVRETCWHYQWAVLHEFLPTLVGQPLVDEVSAEGPRWFRPTGDVHIPTGVCRRCLPVRPLSDSPSVPD